MDGFAHWRQGLEHHPLPHVSLAQGHVAVTHRQPLRLGSAADLHLQFASSARCFWRMKKNFFDSDDV